MSRFFLWWAAFLLSATFFPSFATAPELPAPAGERVFGTAKVVQFHLAMSAEQFAALTPAPGAPTGPPGFGVPREQPEGTHRNTFGVNFPWSQCEFTYNGQTFKNVGIRYKGNYTFMASARSLKKSLKIDLNKHANEQKLDGLTMLNLHCGISDPTKTREALSYAIFRDAGVPTPRTAYAEVTLSVPGKYDKELVGVYTLVEQVNKGFLKDHFKDGKGMLLKPEGLQGGLPNLGTNWKAYEDRYKPDGKPTDKQKKHLIDFTTLINQGTDEDFANKIGSYLDIEAFLKFLAANALLSNLDSYLGYGHNYYLYLVPATNKFVFIPWDLDLSLATWPAAGTPEQLVELSIHHPHSGQNKLIDRLFAIKEHKERYLMIIKDLTNTSFAKKKFLDNLDEIEKSVKEPLGREAKAVALRKEGRVGGFGPGFGGGQFGQSMPPRKFIEKRTESVAAQLEGKTKGFEPKPFGFGPPPKPPLIQAPKKAEPMPKVVAPKSAVSAVTPAEAMAFFEKKIRPVLVMECYACHSRGGDKKIRGGLILDTREGALKGGDTGPVIIPGNPSQSLLLKALSHSDPKLSMPPKKKLDPVIIHDFEEWIRMGAPAPRTEVQGARKEAGTEPGSNHWAYQLPRKSVTPKVKNTAWPRTDVDRFILAALESKEIPPVDDADQQTLFRRVTFDLTGLPPTLSEMEAFAKDSSPNAYEKVVDRLLESPRFGEKWGRHWLDVARYAESTGKTVNFNYSHAWRYRDYVINAFNSDKPYNQFIKEQLAGDLMTSDDPKVKAERLIATGFLAIGPKTLNERNGLKFELDVVDEQIDVTTQAFLGITAACARCHDHKIDPISQKEYYALAGIFRSTETCYGTVRYINAQRQGPLLTLPNEANPTTALPRLTDMERKRIEDQIKGVRDSMRNMKDPTQQFFATGRISLLQARLDAFTPDGTPKLLAMGVRDKPAGPESSPNRSRFGGPGGFSFDGTQTIADSPVYNRGEPDKPGDFRVPRGTLKVLTRTPLQASGSGRLELAEWIANRENPLTARVMANRIWLHLFGRGLVPSPDDFGLGGRTPTHPELLDNLAHHFMDNQWSIKKLIKHLVMSRVYQLGSMANPDAIKTDPDNSLLWRMTPRRLDAESLRDALLAASGQITTTPPVGSVVAQAGEGPVTQPRIGGNQIAAAINDPKNTHRSIYLPIIRDNPPEALSLFDAADPALITSERPRTTVPSQGLFLMNNEMVLRAADATANLLLKTSDSEAKRIQNAFARCYSRQPTTMEQSGAEAFLKAYRAQIAKDRNPGQQEESEVWSAFCQALFASAEFQYRR